MISSSSITRHLRQGALGSIAIGCTLEDFRRMCDAAYVMEVLNQHAWNMTHAAKAMGKHRNTLRRDMQRLQIHIPMRPQGRRLNEKEAA